MFRRLRYALVLFTGALAIVLTLILSAGRTDKNLIAEDGGYAADFSLKALNGFYGGNAAPERAGDGAGAFSAVIPQVETEEYWRSTSLEKPEEFSEEPIKTAAAEIAEAEPETVEETLEEEEEKYGLEAYFENKLVIDEEKVELYLNVREEPDADADILAVLYPNDIVSYTDVDEDWYEVEMDGFSGYVSAEYVLTDEEAYEARKDTVAYAVMTKEDATRFYAEANDSGEVILAAVKGETFRVVSQEGAYYEVSVVSPIYETLFVEKRNVVLYYLFLGPGNDNEMSDEDEEYFAQLEIINNLVKAEKIKIEAEEEQASYEAYLASIEEEQRLAEEAYQQSVAESEAQEAYLQQVAAWQEAERARQEQAAAQAAEASRAAAQAAAAAAQQQAAGNSQNTGGLRSVGVFRITSYCHCQICCGVWGSNDPNYAAHGASGMALQDGYTVAVNPAQIPYGTRLMINGREYVAADCGVGSNCVDIYHKTHAGALSEGMRYAEVFIIE